MFISFGLCHFDMVIAKSKGLNNKEVVWPVNLKFSVSTVINKRNY